MLPSNPRARGRSRPVLRQDDDHPHERYRSVLQHNGWQMPQLGRVKGDRNSTKGLEYPRFECWLMSVLQFSLKPLPDAFVCRLVKPFQNLIDTPLGIGIAS